MLSNIPKMSQAERLARAQEKADAVLSFLASGEVYTTPAVAALLLNVHQTRALACLKSLEKQGLLKSEELYFDARHQKIYGITAHGQASVNCFTGAIFEKGKTNSQYIHHRLFGQRMRIRAEAAGWTAWKHENEIRKEQAALKADDKARWKKIPDSLAINPEKKRIGYEWERAAKSPRRYESFICLHLQQIKLEYYDEVHIVCPVPVDKWVRNAMAKVTSVDLNGTTVKLEPKHLEKFKIFSEDEYLIKKVAKEEKAEVQHG